MAITGIDGMNADAYRDLQLSEMAGAKNEQLKEDLSRVSKNQASDEELMDACKQFEAYFMEQIYKQMVKSVEAINGESTDPQSSLVSFFRDSTLSDIAKTSVDTQGGSLANTLYESMKRNRDSVDPRTVTDA